MARLVISSRRGSVIGAPPCFHSSQIDEWPVIFTSLHWPLFYTVFTTSRKHGDSIPQETITCCLIDSIHNCIPSKSYREKLSDIFLTENRLTDCSIHALRKGIEATGVVFVSLNRESGVTCSLWGCCLWSSRNVLQTVPTFGRICTPMKKNLKRRVLPSNRSSKKSRILSTLPEVMHSINWCFRLSNNLD